MRIQWLGHSAFKLTGDGAQVLIDPFLTGNPKFTGDRDAVIAGTTHVVLTHMHNDHFGDTLDILKATDATLVAMVEIADWVEGHQGGNVIATNYGGTIKTGPLSVSLVPAWHTSGLTQEDGTAIFGGQPAGVIIKIDGHTIYHMGDTTIFSDMALIEELHHPDIGMVPMGGHFTMDAKVAALAVNRYFNFKTVIPCHYGTFPILDPSAQAFADQVEKGQVKLMAPMGVLEV